MKPFTEDKIFELSQPTGSFYSSGSSGGFGYNPGTFGGSLSSKDQVKVSFTVRNPVKMLPKSSSIYYFNRTGGQWQMPPNSVTDHVGPFDKFAVDTSSGWNPPSGSTGVQKTVGTWIAEDYKGFDPFGRAIMSGSLDIYRQIDSTSDLRNSTANFIGSEKRISLQESLEYLLGDYPKSVQRSPVYDATPDQTFELDIKQPFLIEKAVVEIPFALGSSWFQDRSMGTLGFITGAFSNDSSPFPVGLFFEAGGPSITMSLFCQKNYGPVKIRDLVMSGVLTHDKDNKRLSYKDRIGYSYGFMKFISGISGVTSRVSPDSSGMHTGSVKFLCESAVSNGINSAFISLAIITGSKDQNLTSSNPDLYELSYTPEVYLALEEKRLKTKYFSDVADNEFDKFTRQLEGTRLIIGPCDPYGRGMTGFTPSGGSIFGKEHNIPEVAGKGVLNPWRIEDEDDRAASLEEFSSFVNSLATPYLLGGPPYVGAPGPPYYSNGVMGYGYEVIDAGPLAATTTQSPYLVRPGEKLILSLSKTRPATSSSNCLVPDAVSADTGRHRLRSQTYMTGSAAGHDVTLATGSINITFYGSYVREGKTYTR